MFSLALYLGDHFEFKNTQWNFPNNMYLFKINNRNTKEKCEICSTLTTKAPERRQRRSGAFIVNVEQISYLSLALLLLILNK